MFAKVLVRSPLPFSFFFSFSFSFSFCISFCILLFLTASNLPSFSQALSPANVSADIQTDFQYNNDTTSADAMGFHAYMNAGYRYEGLELGMRYEAFQKPLIGYPPGLEGAGLMHRYLSFQRGNFKATAGNFYAQFGNGLVFRSYEARGLGIDNSLDGAKLEYSAGNHVHFTALSGRQRHFAETYDRKSIIRGIDGETNLSNFFSDSAKLIVVMGGSYLNRYFPRWASSLANDSLPPLVHAYAGRLNAQYRGLSLGGEIGFKSSDPSQAGLFLDSLGGKALFLTGSYTRTGMGINLQYKVLKDFGFLSDPTKTAAEYMLNYIPPISRQQEFKLLSKYPYQTQFNGERGYQLEVNYSPKLGNNFSFNHTRISDYTSGLFKGVSTPKGYFTDTNNLYAEYSLQAEHRFSGSFKGTLALQYLEINTDRVLLKTYGRVYAKTIAAEGIYRINRKNSLRADLQYLSTKQDKKSWLYSLAEYTLAPRYSLSVMDEYNIGDTKKHFVTTAVSYIEGNTKFSLAYGKQSAGTVCIGGVCRYVPAFSGLTFSVVSRL